MKNRRGYKGFVIEAHVHELKDGGFSAEFFIEEHDSAGVNVTQFLCAEYLRNKRVRSGSSHTGWAREDRRPFQARADSSEWLNAAQFEVSASISSLV
jgi:hypothetical protein